MRIPPACVLLICLVCVPGFCQAQDLANQASEAMSKAVGYLRSEVAVGGGYLGHYKLDAETRAIIDQWGEGHASATQNWTQPPGNPSVGYAFLRAWEATGDQEYLDGAVEVAGSLVYGQLECGGWDYIVDHSPAGAKRWRYRHNKDSEDESLKTGRNTGTFDDNNTQHATRLLIAVDEALMRQAIPLSIPRVEFRLVPAAYVPADNQWKDRNTNAVVNWEDVLAESEVVFRGSDLEPDACEIVGGDRGHWELAFELQDARKAEFEQFTGERVGRFIAVVLDGKCLTAPMIQAPIPGRGVLLLGPGDGAVFLDDRHRAIHEAALYALEYFLKAQYPGGGWPQRYPLRGVGYGDFFTFNDNSIADCVDVMMIAWRAYGDPRYQDAVLKAGEFIITVQQPEPQPVWAQQYDHDLKPAWARRFEPSSVTAGESRGVIRTLIKIALFTGDEKYLAPIGPALEWYKRSELSKITGKDPGQWARFYELGTNKPLYFTAGTYRLTYDDSNCPDHYSFKGNYYPGREEKQYREIMDKGIEQYKREHEPKALSAEDKLARAEGMEEKVAGIVKAQDGAGRWVKGDLIEMGTFGRNIQSLAAYLRLINDR